MQRAGHSQMATTQRYVAALDDANELRWPAKCGFTVFALILLATPELMSRPNLRRWTCWWTVLLA